jgi:hypothetical protein
MGTRIICPPYWDTSVTGCSLSAVNPKGQSPNRAGCRGQGSSTPYTLEEEERRNIIGE